MESNQEGLTLASCSATQSKSKQSTNFNLVRVRVPRVGGVFASKSKSSSSETRGSQDTPDLLGQTRATLELPFFCRCDPELLGSA